MNIRIMRPVAIVVAFFVWVPTLFTARLDPLSGHKEAGNSARGRHTSIDSHTQFEGGVKIGERVSAP